MLTLRTRYGVQIALKRPNFAHKLPRINEFYRIQGTLSPLVYRRAAPPLAPGDKRLLEKIPELLRAISERLAPPQVVNPVFL